MWCAYILKSTVKNWYYVGSTNNIARRITEHNNGKVSSSRPYKPFTLAYTREFNSEQGARAYEKTLKQKRREKENIIRGLK